jgi:phage repressor protein C with HTH and peptisase S24 domain
MAKPVEGEQKVPEAQSQQPPPQQSVQASQAPQHVQENSREQKKESADAPDDWLPTMYLIMARVAWGLPMHEGKRELRAWVSRFSPEELAEWKANYRQRVERMSQAAEGLGQELMTLLG